MFAIDSIQVHVGKGSIYPKFSFSFGLYPQYNLFVTQKPQQLLQSRNIVYPFDGGTWLFFGVSLLATTVTLILIAIKDEKLGIHKVVKYLSILKR